MSRKLETGRSKTDGIVDSLDYSHLRLGLLVVLALLPLASGKGAI